MLGAARRALPSVRRVRAPTSASQEAAGRHTEPAGQNTEPAVRYMASCSSGRYTPIGLDGGIFRRNHPQPTAHSELGTPPAVDEGPPAAGNSDSQGAGIPTVLASDADTPSPQAAVANSLPLAESTPAIPVAHLLDELRQAVAQLNDEAANVAGHRGMAFGEGSFAVQCLCGVIEQLFGHALRSGARLKLARALLMQPPSPARARAPISPPPPDGPLRSSSHRCGSAIRRLFMHLLVIYRLL